MHIGPYILKSNLIVAPMAGVTDRPFRMLCRAMGAGMAVSEMVSSNSLLWGSEKTRRRANHEGEPAPVSVQIAGADPHMLAQAARYNVDQGAQIIDINMGCPAKKICNVYAGSALLQDEPLVARIVRSVVEAVHVPVTLKIRTVKESLRIPVVANGDIDTPQKAKYVLEHTGADAIMIGRAAQGRPWIFREIEHFLTTREFLPQPDVAEIHAVLLEHIHDVYAFYGDVTGVRVARKHISWYTKGLVGSSAFRHTMNRLDTVAEQLAVVNEYFAQAARADSRLRYETSNDNNNAEEEMPPASRLAA